MSRESFNWLNTMTLIGFTAKRGNAWHYRASEQGIEPNHYADAVPVADVIRRLFDWEAIEVPIYADVPGFGMPLLSDRKGMAHNKTGDVFGIFKDGYTPHQYRESLLDNVSAIIDTSAGDLGVGSAGLLRRGAQAWVSIEVPENIVTPEGVEFRPHLLACTSHDGSLATTYKRVVTNVVCDNTMAAGLSEEGQTYRIKHSRYSKMKLVNARDALAIVHTITEDFAAEVAELCAIDVNGRAWSAFLDAHAPVPETTDRARSMAHTVRGHLTQLWNSDPRVSPWHGTAWGVVQAVNTFEHHTKTVRNASRPERNMARALTGAVDSLDTDTMTTLRKVLATV